MGSPTEIDERTAPISRRLVGLNFFLDNPLLKWIMGKEVEQLLFGEDASFERLLLL